jgi:POT family proton-dependent oligopeptide transporter
MNTTTTDNVNMKQPGGLYLLFFAEMWERFSYYGMRAILVLYMTKELIFSDTLSFMVYGAFTAFVYMTPVFGGMIADKLLGFTRSVKFGAVLIILGHIALALPNIDGLPENIFFYTGLSFIIIGTGFFKANISSMVGHLYERRDPRRSSGFTIFYMGINLGSFLASISVAVVAEWLGWHYGFALAAIGMFLGLVTFMYADHIKIFSPDSDRPNLAILRQKLFAGFSVNVTIYVVAILLVPVFAWLLANPGGSRMTLLVVGAAIVLYFLYQAMISNKQEL